MAQLVLLLGGNMGDRELLLDRAKNEICWKIGILVRESKVYESEPWGFSAAQNFLNQALVVDTIFSPPEVLQKIQAIEKDLGRIRRENKGENGDPLYESRPIDIDILFYDDLILDSERLTIPHPLIAKREFVLVPLREVMGEYIHPVLKKAIREL